MNHLYRSLWNDVTRTFVAVAEVARGRGKRSSGSRTAGSGEAAVAPARTLLRPMALEPRLMFDAAAVATVVEAVVADAATPAAADHVAPLVEAARQWTQGVPAAVEVPRHEVPLSHTGPARRELVFVDASVTDAQGLVDAIDPAAEVILIPAWANGLQAIADALHGRSNIDAIHILSHGDTGKIQLGGAWIDSVGIAANTELLASIGKSLSDSGDILLYGCRVGADGTGVGFLQALAAATGADIAASRDATGASSHGGNWVLEATQGTIDAASMSPASYTGLLAAFSDDFSSNPGTSADSHVRTLGGVNFTYTFTGDGDGGDGSGGLYFDSYGSGGSPAMVLKSGTIEHSTTERVTITRTDLADFTLTSLFVDNSGGGDNVTVGGYLNGVLVGSAQTFTTGTATLNFGGIRVDEVRLTSTDFRDFGIDDFAGDTDPPSAAPTIANLHGDNVAWAGVGSTVTLDASGNAIVVDAEFGALNGGNGNWSGASLTVQRSGTAVSADVLGFNTSGASFTVSGGNLQSGGLTFATFTNTGGTLTVSFTSSGTAATTALVQDVMRHVTYRSDTPAGDATVRFTLNDGSASSTADVTVTSNTIYVTSTSDTATIDASDGVGLREAVAIAAADSTGAQTIILSSALAGQTITLGSTLSLGESLALDADAASGVIITGSTLSLGAGTTLGFSHGSGDTAVINSTLSGSGALATSGAGTLTLGSTGNHAGWSGAMSVTGGTLTAGMGSNPASTLSSGTLTLDGGTLAMLISGAGSTSTVANNVVLGAGGGTVNITGGGGANTANFTGVVSGGALTKTGASILQLSGNNTFTGSAGVQAGTLVVNHANALGTTAGATSVASGATLRVAGGLTVAEGIAIAGTGTSISSVPYGALHLGAGSTTLSGTVTLSADAAVSIASGATLSISGLLAGGAQTLTAVSAGTLVLSNAGNAAAMSGGITVSGGTLSIAQASQLSGGALTLDGATLAVTSSSAETLTNAIVIGSGGATFNKTTSGGLTLSGTLNGSGAITNAGAAVDHTGTGTLTLDGGGIAAGFSGAFTLGSNLVLGSGGATFSADANIVLRGALSGTGAYVKSGNGWLSLAGANTHSGTQSIDAGLLVLNPGSSLGSGQIRLGNGALLGFLSVGTATVANDIVLTGAAASIANGNGGNSNVTLTGTITESGGSRSLSVTAGSGANSQLTLAGAASYTGTTTVAGSVVSITGAGNLGSGALTLASDATLRITGSSAVVSQNISLSGWATIDVTNAATLSGVLSGSQTLTKAGAGTLTLSGANTLGGAVTVAAGTLALGGGAALADTAAVTVNAGGTLVLNASEGIASLAGAGSVSLGANTLTTNGSASTNFSGAITGTGGLTKSGTGTLTLSGTNTYSGATTLNAGSLTLTGGAALSDSSAVTLNAGTTLTLAASETVGSLAGSGSVALGASTLTAGADGSSTTFAGVIGGTGGFAKSGSGTLTLTGNNTYTGVTTVAAGTLAANRTGGAIADASAVTVASGASLWLRQDEVLASLAGAGALTLDGYLLLGGAASTTFSGQITGAGPLYVDGGGTLTLTGSNSGSYTGGMFVRFGSALAVAGDANLGSGVVTLNGGTLSVTGAGTIDNGITLDGGGGTVDVRAAVTLSGALGGAGTLTVADNGNNSMGELTLSNNGNATTFAGDVVVNRALWIAGDANLGSGSLTLDGGYLFLSGGSVIDNAVVLNGFRSYVYAQYSQSGATTFSGSIAGTGGLETLGSLRIAGVASYTGFTWVLGGVLEVTGSLTGSTFVYVGGELGGTGSIGTPGVLSELSTQSGGRVSPGQGAGGIGTLTLNSDWNAAFSAQLKVDVRGTTAGATHDQVVVQGAVALSGATLTPDFGNYVATAGDVFELIRNDGSDAVTPFSFQPEGTLFTANGRSYRLSYVGGDGNDVTLTALNAAPTLVNALGAQSATEDSAFSFTVPVNTFADIDVGDAPSYSATLADGSALPAWLSFDAATRTFSGTPLNGNVGAITVKVTATDGSNNTGSGNFVLTVANTNDAPTGNGIAPQSAAEDVAFSFTLPANAFVDVDAGDTLSYTATQANGEALPTWLSFDAATRTFSGTPLNGDVGAISVRVTATDGSNASAASSFTLTVANTNDAPTGSAIAARFATEDSAFSFQVPANTFADIDAGDTLTYTATLANGAALPAWLSFDAATRTFAGTPLNGDVGAITVKVTATDGSNASASSDFALTVANTNDAPTSITVAAQVAAEDDMFSFAVPASTFSDVDAGDTLTYAATLADGSALPGWLSFNAATRTFTGIPSNGDVGAITVRVTATDGSNASASSDFALTIINTNDAPTVANALAAQAALEDSAFGFVVPADTFADVDVGDSFSYTATLADGAALPAWLSFNAATRSFSGTPSNGDVGTITVKVTATDGSGASAASSFTLTVANTNDAPTVANGVTAQAATEDGAFSFTVPAGTFADIDAGDTLTYTATLANGAALPGWLSFDAATRSFSGTPLNGDVGTITVKVTASDGSGASAASDFTLTVANTNDAPTVANGLTTQAATEDSAFSFTVPASTFADIDVGDTLTYTATLASGAALPAWLSFDAATRSFSGTPANGDVGAISLRVTASDGSGASAAGSFTLTVANTNDAPISSAIAAQAATEDSAFSFTVPAGTFADIDAGDTLTYTATLASGAALPAWLSFDAATRSFSGTPANGDVGTISLRVTATDGSGSSAASSFTLTVANTNDAPTSGGIAAQSTPDSSPFSFTVPAGAFTDVDAGDALSYSATLASGGALPAWLSFDPTTRTFSGTPAFADVGAITLRVTATDASGARVASDFTLTVTLSPPPPLVPVPPAAPEAPPAAPPAPAPAAEPRPATAPVAEFFTAAPSGVVLDGVLQPTAPTVLAPLPQGGQGVAPPALQVAPTLGTLVLGGSTQRSVEVPVSAFVLSSAEGAITVEARQANGQPLPSWLRFDPASGKLVGRAPAGARGVIQVVLTARDSQGQSATTRLEIRLDDARPADGATPVPLDGREPVQPGRSQSLNRAQDAPERLAARPGLSEQLRQARGLTRQALAALPRADHTGWPRG